jgi:hypothetical protein
MARWAIASEKVRGVALNQERGAGEAARCNARGKKVQYASVAKMC